MKNMENLKLNVSLLRQRVPHLTSAARSVGLRSATVSNLCTGKTPVGRAEVRTLVALAALANCKLDELIIREGMFEMLETGIKVIDVFAPLAKGGTAGLVARPGMGQLVVLTEIFYRMKKQGYVTVLLQPEGNYPEINDTLTEVDIVCKSADEAWTKLKELGEEREVIFAADRSSVISGELYDLGDKLHEAGIHSVTKLLVDLKGQSVDEDLPYGPLETLWQFDAELAARYIYPAVNPIVSTSTITENSQMEKTHQKIQQDAIKTLRRYRELRFLVNAHGIEKLNEEDTLTYLRGEKLEAYLTQPFYVAESFTGIEGKDVSLEHALADIKNILEGSEDKKDTEKLKFIGTI
jgi:F-type H+/Na+-transporting ATPase subunit beta